MGNDQQSGVGLRGCPGFGPFWAAATVSAFGTYVTTLAIQVLIVLTLHGGAAEVGLINAARWLPYLLFGVVAGVFVDRVRRRPVLIATDFARAALLVAIPALAVTHRLSMAALAGFMIVFGLASLANDSASQSFLPRLVPRRLLTSANARLDQSDAVAQTSGPALAGGLVSLLSPPWAVLVDAVSYLGSGLLLLRVRTAEPPSRRLSVRGVRGEALEGLRWLYRHPTLGPQALFAHGWFLVNSVAGATMPLFALRTLDLSPFGLGLALAAGGVGGLLGALAATPLGTRFGVGPTVIASSLGKRSGLGSHRLELAGLGGVDRVRRGPVPVRPHLGDVERERDGLRPGSHTRSPSGAVQRHQTVDQQGDDRHRRAARRSACRCRRLPPDALLGRGRLCARGALSGHQPVPTRPHRRQRARTRLSGAPTASCLPGPVPPDLPQ